MSERRLYVNPNDGYQTDVLAPAIRASEPGGEDVEVIELSQPDDLSALVGDPTEPNPVGYIPAADEAEGAPLRTSHNFEASDSKVHTSWYQDGVRLWDVEDPTKSTELTAWVSPDGQAF